MLRVGEMGACGGLMVKSSFVKFVLEKASAANLSVIYRHHSAQKAPLLRVSCFFLPADTNAMVIKTWPM